ncbi:hypothetical protein H5410_037603 [Solanum commersonii]|uniref:AMP-dependent synthetase/ligase domain-containing protein n=1 Tax=Solanum commersonii TaxID=4109 RepID=A0A9J5Y6R1_SOLCO|nr:hypothetical protein H5410_037603 [Solanum commersonii]
MFFAIELRLCLGLASVKYTWEETQSRCLKLASALVHLGISRGDVVATLAPNVPVMHAGATFCSTNGGSSSLWIAIASTNSFQNGATRIRVSHGYGLTETYSAATSCLWKREWDYLPLEERAALKSRQGVQHLCIEKVDVKDPDTMERKSAS